MHRLRVDPAAISAFPKTDLIATRRNAEDLTGDALEEWRSTIDG